MAKAETDETRRARILEGTLTIIFREGVSSVNMDEIARKQGISKKTLYKYFSNKSQLVEEAVESRIQELAGRIRGVAYDSAIPFMDKLGAVLGIIGRQFAEIGENLVKDLFYREPHLWERIDRFRREQVYGLITDLFKEGIREGYVRADIDGQLVIDIFIATVNAILNPAQFFSMATTPTMALESLVKIMLEGILTPAGRGKLSRGRR